LVCGSPLPLFPGFPLATATFNRRWPLYLNSFLRPGSFGLVCLFYELETDADLFVGIPANDFYRPGRKRQ
jgi:hypothetical protein